jgi:hypothetical protein
VSRALGIHADHLRRLVKSGVLPAEKIGGEHHFAAEEVWLYARWGGPLISTGRAAVALGISRSAFLRQAGDARLPYFPTANGRLFLRDSLLELDQRRRRGRDRAASPPKRPSAE